MQPETPRKPTTTTTTTTTAPSAPGRTTRATRTGPTGPAKLAVAAVPALLALATVAGCGDDGGDDAGGAASEERQEEVARRGAEVMPFDLETTTHRFVPADDGLVQTVVADDPDDAEQVDLIRAHLSEEAERFSRGDYGDPETIHGESMPGLRELEAAAGEVEIDYETVDGGARLTYTTGDPALVDALHRWGEAQVTDHGDHAER